MGFTWEFNEPWSCVSWDSRYSTHRSEQLIRKTEANARETKPITLNPT